ncbi:hypothetical protein SAMN06298216_2276 [Spirosomataceae bacterium TFI 002]|nr:hypothetical protein SAMN06298216_2276 [Spirosomataceae bacterium TFI 002]
MLVHDSFRFYKSMFSRFPVKVDRNLNIFVFYFYSLALAISCLGVCLIIIILLRIIIKYKNNELVTIVFTKYDYTLAKKLQENGINLNIICIGFDCKCGHATTSYSNLIIFLSSFANPLSTLRALWCTRNDEVLSNNKLRIAKLSGLKQIIPILISQGKVAINFNDHSVYNVLYFDIAKKKSLNTIYIQHAPVGEHFPPLYHDLNILYSNDSLKKYKNPFNKEIFVLFDLRFLDIDKSDNSEEFENTVLICTNILDSTEEIVKTAESLASHGYKIILRPHPRDNRSLPKLESITISQGNSLWFDLNKSQIILANESAVFLEAAYLDKLFYKCAYFSSTLDNYDFIKNGAITREYFDFPSVLKDLKDNYLSYNKNKIEYYIGNVINWELKMTELKQKIYNIND